MLNSHRVRQIFILFHGSMTICILIKFPWPLELKYPNIITHLPPHIEIGMVLLQLTIIAGLICIER